LEFYTRNFDVSSECPICFDTESDIIFKPCGHKVCRQCSTKMRQARCPMCRSVVMEFANTKNDGSVESDSFEEVVNAFENLGISCSSSKIKKLKEFVVCHPEEKIVVVSQWTSMLTLVEQELQNESISYVVISGNTNKTKNIQKFQEDPDVKICLLSLTACAEGITLTSAKYMILLDSWWNKSLMTQVTDRIYRIGQMRNVEIVKFICKDTIEEKVEELVHMKYLKTNSIMASMFNFDESLLERTIRWLE